MIGERDDRSHMTKNHMRMNLAVGMSINLVGEHCDTYDLGFIGIHVFYTRAHPVVPHIRCGRRNQFTIHDSEDRTNKTTSVGLNQDAIRHDIPGDGDMGMNRPRMLRILELGVDGYRRIRVGHNHAVDQDCDLTS